MNNNVFKRVIFLLLIVLFTFSLSACKTMKAAVSFKWGQWTGNGHPYEVEKVQKEGTTVDQMSMMNTEQKILVLSIH